MNWKIEKIFPHQIHNSHSLAVSSNHTIFLQNAGFRIFTFGPEDLELVSEASVVSNLVSYQNGRVYFVTQDGYPVWIDMEGQKVVSKSSLHNLALLTVAIDENNDLYVLQGDSQMNIFDKDTLERKLWLTDKCKRQTAFVVHQNIKYGITADSIEILNLTDMTVSTMQISIGKKPAYFSKLLAITVDHKNHKLYVIDSASVLEIPLKKPYQAQVIYFSPSQNRRQRPNEICAVDGKVYVTECTHAGTMFVYRLIVLEEKLMWNIQKLLWIGHLKCEQKECGFAQLPKELVKLIINFLRQ